jgi:hypothetical protein
VGQRAGQLQPEELDDSLERGELLPLVRPDTDGYRR